ncbi:hypothetical protein DT065_09790 [Salicibibacter kimchii]|uniref:Uncharacterized protein n=1 Tax=Salicibibacter kimchii TaxID=2099786 RepID=A0A345BZ98_9BACI|nr:hypothetical protein DT065_09790 [Salicibibacter kimchii]
MKEEQRRTRKPKYARHRHGIEGKEKRLRRGEDRVGIKRDLSCAGKPKLGRDEINLLPLKFFSLLLR